MTDKTVYDEASEVDAEDGTVVVNGPDAVDVRLTPDAAEETSERLNTGAMKARGQLYFTDRQK
jgi:sugar lactone lactonase YvrE